MSVPSTSPTSRPAGYNLVETTIVERAQMDLRRYGYANLLTVCAGGFTAAVVIFVAFNAVFELANRNGTSMSNIVVIGAAIVFASIAASMATRLSTSTSKEYAQGVIKDYEDAMKNS